MIKFNEQRRHIENEIKQGVHASTASLLSSGSDRLQSDADNGELLTIKDYQSVMES